MSKIRKRINPIVKKNKTLVIENEFNSSRQKANTRGIEVNSSHITSGGSSFPKRTSARVLRGIPTIKRTENRIIIPIGERGENQNKKQKASRPASEPNVPGAGKFVPTGPRVDKFRMKKSITDLLR
jgi:hypothetical protein